MTESNLELDELKKISDQLTDIYQFMIDKLESDNLKEQEKLENDLINAEDQMRIDDEQQQIKQLREEELLLLESEFRENVVLNIQELKTAIDNLPNENFNVKNDELNNLSLINQSLNTVIEPVEPSEQELTQSYLTQQASIGIIFAIFIMIPVYFVIKFLSFAVNRLLNNIF